MAANDFEGRYKRSLQRLSELVQERDRCLMELETLASLPLSIGPRSGHVAEFDLGKARELLDSVQRQTRLIEVAIAAANEAAQAISRPQVTWMKISRNGK